MQGYTVTMQCWGAYWMTTMIQQVQVQDCLSFHIDSPNELDLIESIALRAPCHCPSSMVDCQQALLWPQVSLNLGCLAMCLPDDLLN